MQNRVGNILALSLMLFGAFAISFSLAGAVQEPISLVSCATLDQPDTTYVLTRSLTNRMGTCFTITASGVVLNGNGFSIAGDNSGVDYGVYIQSANNVVVKNFAGIQSFNDGVYLYSNPQNALVTSNVIGPNSRSGVALGQASLGNIIEGNTIKNNPFGVYIDDVYVQQNIIRNNVFANNTNGAYLKGQNADFNKLIGNTFTGTSNHSIILLGGSTEVRSNTIRGTTLSNDLNVAGVFVSSTDGYGREHTIIGNNISFMRKGVSLNSASSNTIFDNFLSNNYEGISLLSGTNNIIGNNTISGDTTGMLGFNGIYLNGATDNRIERNAITNNYFGISLESSDRNQISNNIARQNNKVFANGAVSGVGIALLRSNDNQITDNDASRQAHGIYIYLSENNLVNGNTISNNLYDGIKMDGGGKNVTGGNIGGNHNVSNNFLSGNGIMTIYGGKGDIISKNTLVGGGIYTATAESTITSNDLTEGGIIISSTESNKVMQNRITRSPIGIDFSFADSNIVSENTILNSTLYGAIFSFSDDNYLTKNTISGSGIYGVALEFSHFNTITENIFSANAQNIFLGRQSESNQISWNTGASLSSLTQQQQQKTTEVKKGPRVEGAFTPVKNQTASPTTNILPAAAPAATIRLFAKGTGSGAIGSGSLRNY